MTCNDVDWNIISVVITAAATLMLALVSAQNYLLYKRLTYIGIQGEIQKQMIERATTINFKNGEITNHPISNVVVSDVIVAIQILDALLLTHDDTYLKRKRDFFLKIFWLQLNTPVRTMFEDQINWGVKCAEPKDENEIYLDQLATINNNLRKFFSKIIINN